MFRRTKAETIATPSSTKVGGKGRATPTRREAEAANKAKAKPVRTRKERLAAGRESRSGDGDKVRAALRGRGDQRYLPVRDRGPVRAFLRDLVDSRFSLVNLLIPLMLLVLILGWTGNRQLVGIGNSALIGILVLVVVEMLVLRRRIRRELATRFPGETTKGTTYYATIRALQMRFMRLPKPRVKTGQQLPGVYR